MNRFDWRNAMKKAVVATLSIASVPAFADVSVTINDANTATAVIDLPTAADRRNIRRRSRSRSTPATNLSPDSLGLTAEIVDPATFTGLPAGVALDPNFPVVVSVEPQTAIFRNGFESEQSRRRKPVVPQYLRVGNAFGRASGVFVDIIANSVCSRRRTAATTFADITDACLSGQRACTRPRRRVFAIRHRPRQAQFRARCSSDITVRAGGQDPAVVGAIECGRHHRWGVADRTH